MEVTFAVAGELQTTSGAGGARHATRFESSGSALQISRDSGVPLTISALPTGSCGMRTQGMLPARRPLVVEIAGPAGAGKTTVLHSLKYRSRKVSSVALPRFRSVEGLPFFAEHGLLLLPTLLRLAMQNGRGLTRHEISSMITLNGWHRLCRRDAAGNGSVRLLDQASVFMMAELHEFGPESLRSPGAQKWWNRVYRQWAATLDLVIWLDASDTILRDRIRSRRRWHVMKDKPADEVFDFLARYRRAYEQAISALKADNPGLRVLRIDTGDKTVAQVVERLTFDLGLQSNDPEPVL